MQLFHDSKKIKVVRLDLIGNKAISSSTADITLVAIKVAACTYMLIQLYQLLSATPKKQWVQEITSSSK